MASTDYSDGGLQLTPIRGLRKWRVTDEGWLRSLFKGYIWVDGENVCECLKVDPDAYMMHAYYPYMHRGGAFDGGELQSRPHDMADCTCGFYAFNERSSDYDYNAQVIGVVEQYGDVYLGTKGSRATRARPLALCMPAKSRRLLKPARMYTREYQEPLTAVQRRLVEQNYPGVAISRTIGAMLRDFPIDKPETKERP